MLDNKKNKLRGPGLEVSMGIAQDSMQEAALGSLQTTQTSETAVADVDGIWQDFAQWAKSLPRLPPGKRASLKELYIQR